MTAGANAGGLQLQATFTGGTQHLEVAYTLENKTGEDVYVFDGLFQAIPTGVALDLSAAYTIIEDDLLTLFRGVVKIPPRVQVEAPEMPLARMLPKGEKLSGVIRAKLPLRYDYPYHWVKETKVARTLRVRLRIGCAPASAVQPLPGKAKSESETLYRIEYRQVIGIQQLVETPVQELALTVLLRP